jgi:putative ABC transport system ATP-binding protein
MTDSKQPVVQAQNVTKTFFSRAQNVTVLSDINLVVKAGEFLVMFGPSGCGKSTLLHILLGLEEPTAGTVSFLGRSLYAALDEDERSDLRKKHVGMVYQQPNWIKALTVNENVMFALRLCGMPASQAKTRALAALELVGMQEWQDYIPTELSSGQQQKVALARAMVTNPDIIIADEPTGNLDFESGRELMKLLASMHRQGKTVIMVTHDLEYLGYAQRGLELFDGKIVHEHTSPQAYLDQSRSLKRGLTEGGK